MIYWFWGYPGVGKDYVAKKFCALFPVSYVEGDTLLTPTERQKITDGTFTKIDRLEKLARISKQIKEMQGDIAITDSLPDKTSRAFLQNEFGKEIIFIRVITSPEKHQAQLKDRTEHFFTSAMLDQYIEKNWEPVDDFPHTVVQSDALEETLNETLAKIYHGSPSKN